MHVCVFRSILLCSLLFKIPTPPLMVGVLGHLSKGNRRFVSVRERTFCRAFVRRLTLEHGAFELHFSFFVHALIEFVVYNSQRQECLGLSETISYSIRMHILKLFVMVAFLIKLYFV